MHRQPMHQNGRTRRRMDFETWASFKYLAAGGSIYIGHINSAWLRSIMAAQSAPQR